MGEKQNKIKKQKKVNSKLGKIRNFPPNEYELGYNLMVLLFTPIYIGKLSCLVRSLLPIY
jgi:hypothetical protein